MQPSTTSGPAITEVRFRLDGEIGTADRRLFGSFVEHVGRGVYGGLFDPSDPSATPEGFRGDVLALVRELGVTVVRYPGGNFVSGYDWKDGVGPRSSRPRRLDLAWKSIETNAFGTDEFLAWCRRAGVEPMLALNLGLGDVGSALQLVEYVNHPGGTALSDARARNGSPEPGDVRLWCLGNEMDGPWQLGHRSAEQYGDIARATASALRMFDEDLELVAVGSSHAEMPTFGTWDRTVLARTAGLVDLLSCHIYFFDDGDLAAFLRSAEKLDAFLATIAGIVDEANRAHPDGRRVRVSLDEWNVWDFRVHDALKPGLAFAEAPRLLEQEYTLADAVVVGTLLQTILAHADTVAVAALAQLVNAIGVIRTEPGRPAWRQPTFHPFALASRSAGHTVVRTAADAPGGALATVTVAPELDAVRVYLANRDLEHPARVEVDLAGFAPAAATAVCLWGDDPAATNTVDSPSRVAPRPLPAELTGDLLAVTLPPLSWAAVEVTCRPAGR
ncbi:MAG: alpha-L-arabinofuranosidase C-terminal domain-containing protein [Propionicimonas sp.]|nr:alpha-L-arabinofuranosidase C-terminal domain-containing protein [Propionicimonas sp.]